MTIFRVQHNKNYIIVNNHICKDNTISWKAKGIWLYAFSRKDDWEFYLKDIINQSTDGKESVQAGLKELEKAGYLVRVQTRKEGKIGYEWTFFETPQEIKIILPQQGKPATVEPATVLPPLISIEETCIEKEQQQHQEKTTPKPPQAPSFVVVDFYKCLEGKDVTDVDKIWLSKYYSEDEVKQGIAFCEHPETKIKTTFVQTLKWACENKLPVPVGKDEKSIKHKKTAEALQRWFKSDLCSIECLTKEIQFIPKAGVCVCVEYSASDFIPRCKNLIDHYEFKDSRPA